MEAVEETKRQIQANFFSQEFRCKIKHIPLKRIFDILFSLVLLVLLSPFFILIALLIKLTSKGPVFYSHERIGRGGKPFSCYKFRTMHQNSDKKIHEILQGSEQLREEWNLTRKLKKDPRITPIGAFLRRTSIDEFPQFWNVLKGDLSVVGPRPVMKEEVAQYFGLKCEKILSVRPGITGIWQVSGRSNTGYEARILMDERYVDDHSLLFDIKLILKTIPCLLGSSNAC